MSSAIALATPSDEFSGVACPDADDSTGACPAPVLVRRPAPSRIPVAVEACSDVDLLRRMSVSDRAAFEELYRRYRSAALATARRVCGPSLAEDALQEAFTSIWRAAGVYRAELGTPRNWIMGIVHNRAIDALRRHHRHTQRREADAGLEELVGDQHTEQEALRRDEARALRCALPHLSPAQRDVLEMSFYDGLSQREIAHLTGAPLGTVKGRMRLALIRLRRDLLAAGFATP